MKKVNVVTYYVHNSYGSVLQLIGLKKTLETLDVAIRLIETEVFPENESKIRWDGPVTIKHGLIFLFKLLNARQLKRKYNNTMRFMNEQVEIAYYRDYTQLIHDVSQDALFLAGSDQIWNPQKMYAPFFLDFAPPASKKISYAASMGTFNIPTEQKERFGELLANMDTISVREKQMVDVLKEYTDKPIEVHIDPTFLLDAEEWRLLSRPYPIDEPYILVYALYWSSKYNPLLKQLHKETGLKIVVISNTPKPIYADKWVFDADPAQFLWLIDHAEMVVSSSFHGVALSLILNKKLSAVINPAAPSRIEDILHTLQYTNIELSSIAQETAPDYETVNKRIREERTRSVAYLSEVLSSEY